MKRLIKGFFTSALLWGGLATAGFYTAVARGLITDPLVLRYTAGHPVEYIIVGMFLIGMVALLFKYLGVLHQQRAMSLGPVFPPIRKKREKCGRADEYLETINRAEQVRGKSLHLDRLRRALLFLKSSRRVEELDTELRLLAEDDEAASERGYGMVRMFIWAIPILGFLGTVVGITMALGNLDLTELESSSQNLASGLNVAFDTTALALTLVFFLYFSLFFVQRVEGRLFARVTRLVDSEMRGRFARIPSENEQNNTRAVRHMLKTLCGAFDKMVQAQIQRWEDALAKAERQTSELVRQGGEQIRQVLQDSFKESVGQHARMISGAEEKLLSETLTPYIRALKESAEKISSLQDRFAEEGALFRDILSATGKISMLEDRLNENLHALSQAGCFSETVSSLAAVIPLLYSRLGAPMPAKPQTPSRLSPLFQSTPAPEPKPIEQKPAEEQADSIRVHPRHSVFGRRASRKGKSA